MIHDDLMKQRLLVHCEHTCWIVGLLDCWLLVCGHIVNRGLTQHEVASLIS